MQDIREGHREGSVPKAEFAVRRPG